MKRSVGALVTLAALLLLFSPRGVGAAPATPCPDAPETVFLAPEEAWADGVQLSRSATTGRYVTDAGMEFDVESVFVTALAGEIVEGCMQPSTKLSVELFDPFTGAWHLMSMEQAP